MRVSFKRSLILIKEATESPFPAEKKVDEEREGRR